MRILVSYQLKILKMNISKFIVSCYMHIFQYQSDLNIQIIQNSYFNNTPYENFYTFRNTDNVITVKSVTDNFTSII